MPSPKDTKGPVVKTGPTKGENRSRNNDGQWRKKRDDAGKSREEKKSSGCFITTAVCHYRGLKNDCYELRLLRAFRDDHLMQKPEGVALVDLYYQEAPFIASKLIHPEDLSYTWYSITKCVGLIETGKYEEAVQEYREMFLDLKNRILNADV